MPKFQNKSKSRIDLIYNGRKIIIPIGGIIEGPPHLKIYKGLELYNDEILFQPIKQSLIEFNDDDSKQNNENIDKTIRYINEYGILPSVSICILTKNKLHLISDCINSILDKVKYKNTKIIIFDTGSDEVEVIAYYKTLVNSKIPITIYNIGKYNFSKNYNDGIAQYVDTEYCLIQNNDTVALNDYVTKLMKVAIIEKIGASGPRMTYKNGSIQHDGQILFNHNAGNGFINPGHLHIGMNPKQLDGGRHIVDGITGAGLLVRTSLYKKLGGFDSNFKDIYQDVHYNMLLRGSGYLSICDWDSVIHHYDNSSRKDLWGNKEDHAKMINDSDYLFRELIPKNPILGNFKRKTPIFSIVTLVNNKEQYINLLNDLRKQTFKGKFEIVALPNFNNEYSSASEALNIGKDLSEGKYVIYCHQDLRVPDYWLKKISLIINTIDDTTLGFMGMAGVSYLDNPNQNDAAIYLSNTNSNNIKNSDIYKNMVGDKFEVQCLDELCIIGKRDNKYRFDETNFNHYHWYGADICMQAISDGKKNYAINSDCLHLSDGIYNLFKEQHIEKYIEGAKKMYLKWCPKFDKFRTTTAKFNKSTKNINILFYSLLPESIKNKFTESIKMPY